MASASTAPPELIFQGPAGQRVSSFQQLCTDSLDNSNTRWKDYENPKSSVIPQIVIYKNSDKSDSDVESDQRQTIDRQSDSAEHLIHKALGELIDEKNLAPFIVVQGTDLNNFKQTTSDLYRVLLVHLQQAPRQRSIFEDCFREYDYIVIGPKIGFIDIEVKGSYFNKARDFKHGSRSFPDGYRKGIVQLNSVEMLVKFLSKFAGISATSFVAKKILFTPNLEGERYNRWISSLTEPQWHAADGEVDEIDQWFHEDVEDLKSKLNLLLRNSEEMPADVYESLAPIIVGLASVKIFRSSVKLDPSRLRQSDAVYQESWRVHQQDPLEEHYPMENQTPLEKKHPERTIRRINADLTDVKYLTSIILTPAQLAALKQPSNRHLIIGSAGVGKTIILQEKAKELFPCGKSVTVLANENCGKTYEKLFNYYGYESFRVEKWKDVKDAAFQINYDCDPEFDAQETSDSKVHHNRMLDIFNDILDSCLDQDLTVDEKKLEEIFERHATPCTSSRVPVLTDIMKRLLSISLNTDCILIDDTFDCEQYNYEILNAQLAVICLMLINLRKKAQDVLWIAFDPYSELCDRNQNSRRKCRMAFLEEGPYKDAFAISCLHRVLRCPQTVYDVSYKCIRKVKCSYTSTDVNRKLKPELGHKIQGLYMSRIFEDDTLDIDYFLSTVWENVLSELDAPGYNYEQSAIIIVDPQEPFSLAYISNLYKGHIRTTLSTTGEDQNTLEEKVNRFANVFSYDQLSSMEWPVVIVIVRGTRKWVETVGAYRVYRACSRATGKLVMIRMSCPFKRNEKIRLTPSSSA